MIVAEVLQSVESKGKGRFYVEFFRKEGKIWSMNPLLDNVEYVETIAPERQQGNLRVASYNIERGLRLDAIIDQWRQHQAHLNDVILISEADQGRARSGNRHITLCYHYGQWQFGLCPPVSITLLGG